MWEFIAITGTCLLVLPILAYFITKTATLGFYRGRQLFLEGYEEDRKQREEGEEEEEEEDENCCVPKINSANISEVPIGTDSTTAPTAPFGISKDPSEGFVTPFCGSVSILPRKFNTQCSHIPLSPAGSGDSVMILPEKLNPQQSQIPSYVECGSIVITPEEFNKLSPQILPKTTPLVVTFSPPGINFSSANMGVLPEKFNNVSPQGSIPKQVKCEAIPSRTPDNLGLSDGHSS